MDIIRNHRQNRGSFMQLFYAPMACSLAPRIALYEAGITADYVRVNLLTKRDETGGNYLELSTKGQVPALRLDNGLIMTEGPSILQYIADAVPESGLAPAPGSPDRYRLHEWLNYITSEMHKQILWTIFSPDTPPEAKQFVKTLVPKRLTFLDASLSKQDYLLGDRFSVADAYLFWVLTLFGMAKLPMEEFAAVEAFRSRVAVRPAVARALDEELAISRTPAP
jgi:glutathione S-transferase